MSYYMYQLDSDFGIIEGKEENLRKALYEWFLKEGYYAAESDSIEELFKETHWKYSKEYGLYYIGYGHDPDYDDMFYTIAEFVKDGSYIHMTGEDGEFKWVFEDGICRIEEIDFDDVERLKILLDNTISLLIDQGFYAYDTREDFMNMLCNEIGTTEEELEGYGVSI